MLMLRKRRLVLVVQRVEFGQATVASCERKLAFRHRRAFRDGDIVGDVVDACVTEKLEGLQQATSRRRPSQQLAIWCG